MRMFGFRFLAGALALLSITAAGPAAAKPQWVTTWASAQMVPVNDQVIPDDTLDDSTIRQLVRTSIGGQRLRVRLSNAFGREALKIGGASIALSADPASSRIVANSGRPLTFSGAREFSIPAGAEYLSDPVDFIVGPMTTLAVSIHFADQASVMTGHPGSRATSYIVRGNRLTAAEFAAPKTFDRWVHISGVDVLPKRTSAAIAVLGDSITDGFGVKPNTNSRWTDFLIPRLAASPATRNLALLNLGIGGNRILADGLGPNAVARFERDILMRDGVKHLIIFEGVNDLGTLTREAPVSAAEHRAFVQRFLTGYAQIVARARNRGIKVIGATILPYGGSAYYHPDAQNEADRQAINAWIRKAGNVDAVIDFDAVMRDPARPNFLKKELDSGDGLHPSIEGYRVMGEAVPLSLFR
jgi:lysophospholipase L1-like esterase